MNSIYRKVYPTSAVPTKFYGLPKIHKVGTPLRPIVSSRGSITYGVAKVFSGIIHPVVGQSPHHHKNTQHFVEHIKQVKSLHHMMSRHYSLSSSGPLHTNSALKVITESHITTKDQHVHPTNNQVTGVLP